MLSELLVDFVLAVFTAATGVPVSVPAVVLLPARAGGRRRTQQNAG